MKKQKNNKRQKPAVPVVPLTVAPVVPLTAAEEALLHDLSGESHADKPKPPALLLPEIPSPTVHGADTMASEEKAEEESAEDALLRALLQSAYPSPPEKRPDKGLRACETAENAQSGRQMGQRGGVLRDALLAGDRGKSHAPQ